MSPAAGTRGPGAPGGGPAGQGTAPMSQTGGPGQAGGGRGQAGGGPAQAGGPGAEEADFDPERTVSIARPKGPFSAPPEQGRPPQQPGDEGAISTMRIQSPQSGSPGQQVYPLPTPPMHQQQGTPQQQHGMPQQQAMPPDAQQYGQQGQPGQPGLHQGKGLGTDLFAIASQPEEKPEGNRNGMLVLMAVAAAAAVVIAVLIVALFSS